MKQDKQTNLKTLRAAEGKVLPVFYKGSIIHIDDKEAKEIDWSLLGYEPKIQLEAALKDKSILEIGSKK